MQLTDNRPVVLHMNRMARVGVEFINNLADPDSFVRAVHVTGDLENLGQGTPEDKRYFVTVADERTILHFGSSYGGNALLGKIAHGLRQATYDGWASGEFLAEQFMLLGITDKVTGKKWHIAGGFPSASGKTNLAMTLSPDALGDRYYVEFYGDDIAWMWVGEDGRLYGMNPEFGVFGVAKDTNEKTNPGAIEAIAPGTRAIFTNVAYNAKTQETWFEGRTPNPAGGPRRLAGLEGQPDRGPLRRGGERPLGAPEQPVHHHAGQRAQHRGRLRQPGRRADRRHHLRRPYPGPRAADPGDHRRRRGRVRRAHAGRRGDLRRRRPRRAAPLRPDVDAPVHVLPRGPVRRALARRSSARAPASPSSPTSTGSSGTPRTAISCGPATGTTCARCCG